MRAITLPNSSAGSFGDRRAKLFGIAHGPVHARGADDCLGRHRPDIQRVSAQAIALDEGDGESEPRGGFRRRQSGRPRSHDREIIAASRLGVFPVFGPYTAEEGLLSSSGFALDGGILHR